MQISDTHMEQGSVATLQQLADPHQRDAAPPAFVLHTGNETHGQKPGAFDTVAELLKGRKTERVFYAPAEHDVLPDRSTEYLSRYGKGTVGGATDDGGVECRAATGGRASSTSARTSSGS